MPENAVKLRQVLQRLDFQEVEVVVEPRKGARNVGAGEVPAQKGVDDGQQKRKLGHNCHHNDCRQQKPIIVCSCFHKAFSLGKASEAPERTSDAVRKRINYLR